MHFTKSKIEQSRDSTVPFSWPRLVTEDWLELEADIERLQAIVTCCAAECPPNESLEVNERVALLAGEVEQLKQDRQALLDATEQEAKIVEGLAAEVKRLRPIFEAAKHLRTQSRKHTFGCSWFCRNIRELFTAVEVAEAAKEQVETTDTPHDADVKEAVEPP